MSVPTGICTNSGYSLRSMGPENFLALWLLLPWSMTQGDQTLVLFIKHLVKEKNGRIRLIIRNSEAQKKLDCRFRFGWFWR